MNREIKIAKELLVLAKNLIAIRQDYSLFDFDSALERYQKNPNDHVSRNFLLMTSKCPEFVFRANGVLNDKYCKELMSVNPSCPKDILETLKNDPDSKISENARKTLEYGYNSKFKDQDAENAKHRKSEHPDRFLNRSYKELYEKIEEFAKKHNLKFSYNSRDCIVKFVLRNAGKVIQVHFIDMLVKVIEFVENNDKKEEKVLFSKNYADYYDYDGCIAIIEECLEQFGKADSDYSSEISLISEFLGAEKQTRTDEINGKITISKMKSTKQALVMFYDHVLYYSNTSRYEDNSGTMTKSWEEKKRDVITVDFSTNTISVNEKSTKSFNDIENCKKQIIEVLDNLDQKYAKAQQYADEGAALSVTDFGNFVSSDRNAGIKIAKELLRIAKSLVAE